MKFRRQGLKTWAALALGVALAIPLSGLAAPGSRTAAKHTSAMSAMNGPVDINTATMAQLKAVPGIGDVYAKRIIASRPYTSKDQLVSKGVLPQGVYDKVKGELVAHRMKK
jgi:competence protein ComEA